MSKKKGGLTGAQWHSMLKRFTTEDECFAIPEYTWNERLLMLDNRIDKYRGDHCFYVNIEKSRAGYRVFRGSKLSIVHRILLEQLLTNESIDLTAFISQGNAIPFEYADINRYRRRMKEIRESRKEESKRVHEYRMSTDPNYAKESIRKQKQTEWIAKTQKENNKKSTDSEKLLYKTTLKQFGKRVKKQFEITIKGHIYFLDFYIKSLKVAIEVDGGYHSTIEQSAKDRERDTNLASIGIKTIRIKNEQVTNQNCRDELLRIILSRKKKCKGTYDISTNTHYIGYTQY